MDPLFFQTGQDNPLFRADLVAGVGAAELAGLAIVLALLLGHAAYTDTFCGKIIRNTTTMAIAAVALAALPLIYADPVGQLLSAVAISFGVALLWFVRAIAAGDLKLYAALSLLLGPATVALVFISFFLIIAYSIPLMVRTRKGVHASGEELPRGERLGKPAGAPGIALAVPMTIWAAGADPLYVAALAGGIVLSSALFLLLARSAPLTDSDESVEKAEDGGEHHRIAEVRDEDG